ncbi:cobyrinate a,c-diamide synthase [Limibaculum sp. FT325]|uniref:cobyrinate a,c-diamide synthase n=1 Tax=Thermohalobaculum sediminis TaxID=2939436 RepID=UPI0020BF064C|nr:cobyrinate a,c-diamide synthase [Limibaculum sediminis]MCL5775616.1 cobyrinate a,c-diamide synthase [Limibaculum sediminis]
MTPRGLVVAAPASGAGKTTVTLGLIAALRARGVAVQAAKSGPDYIDPAFLAAASGRPCATLDAFAADAAQLGARAAEALAGGLGGDAPARLLVIEGAMGLFDGADDGSAMGRGSTADVAAALGLPVLLVMDAARMGQGAAAIVAGLARFRADVRVAGVILNRVGSARHAAMLRRAVGAVAPMLGTLTRCDDLSLPSRHLGLVQAGERADLADFIARAAEWVAGGVDLAAVEALASPIGAAAPPRRLPPPGQRVAVARDFAFAFAYPHMLADWRAAGAEIVPFSPLADQAPDPAADAVFLPGGYPELHAGLLAAAGRFRAGMEAAQRRGAAIHGECGGYMVLGEGLVDAGGARHAMLGFLRLETSFAERRLHLGYRRLSPRGGSWSGPLVAHEFHYATTLRAEGAPLYDATDAAGADLGPMGLVSGRVSGSFAHVIEPG